MRIYKLASIYSLLANAEQIEEEIGSENDNENQINETIEEIQESSQVLYHWSNSKELAQLSPGDIFILNPGPQGAEGPGVYFSTKPVRVSTAEGVGRSDIEKPILVTAYFENINTKQWWRSKGRKTVKFNKPQTWHSNNASVKLDIFDIVNYDNYINIFARAKII